MVKLDINTDATVVFTNKLEKWRRSALPNAIRNTLNKAAFDVKQHTMPSSAAANFVKRQSNFFKANSRVDMAKGYNIHGMQATVGFTDNKLNIKSKNYAIKDLEQQERGGTIKKRAFVPINQARTGASATGNVRMANRLSNIKNIVNSNKIAGRSPQQRFIRAAVRAGVGGFVIGNNEPKILYKITGISKGKIKKVALYTYLENRSVSVRSTGFMKKASIQSGKQIEDFYIAEAKRQLERLKK